MRAWAIGMHICRLSFVNEERMAYTLFGMQICHVYKATHMVHGKHAWHCAAAVTTALDGRLSLHPLGDEIRNALRQKVPMCRLDK